MIQISSQLLKTLVGKAPLLSLIFTSIISAGTVAHSLATTTRPTKLLTINSAGTASGNNGSEISGISANGRYVLFTSSATDLVPNDTNLGLQDVFVRDTQTNTTTLVSVNAAGTGTGDFFSETPSMSPNGRYVVFVSASTNLVPVNPGMALNVYLRDLQAGTTKLVSVSALTGLGGNRNSTRPVLSADGRYVAFQSRAFDLGGPDTSEIEDIYVRDTQANTTTLVSINPSGTASGDAESGPFGPFAQNGLSITDNGRYVVFHSRASNLASLPDNNFGSSDVFVRDLQMGTTRYVSINSAGTGGGNTHSATSNITPDGRYVVFVSLASDLTTNDANGFVRDVFIRDLHAGVTTLVSVNSAGMSGNFDSPANGEPAVVSADGRYVAFQSGASNLYANDNNNFVDVFVRDVQAGITHLASINNTGTATANSVSTGPAISADGRFVGFISFASNLTTTPDANTIRDIYLRDMRTGITALVSINALGTAAGNNESASLLISASGRYVTLASYASNLTTITDLNNSSDVFLFHNSAPRSTAADFDADGKADLSVFRPVNSSWYISQSSNDAFLARQFGLGTDWLVPGDYDNDSKTDLAVFRNGDWFVLQSTNGFIIQRHFGSAGDIPVQADFDNDGKTDFAVFSPTTNVWYVERSSDFGLIVESFGLNGDLPVPGDYDGNGSADIAVWRPSNGTWYTSLNPATNYAAVQFGINGDRPVQADYDGDGRTDLAVYRPSTGTWYMLQSTDGLRSERFGLNTDIAVPADYDGDGQSDVAVFRDGDWFIRSSSVSSRASSMETVDQGRHWGQSGDKPLPAAYVPE